LRISRTSASTGITTAAWRATPRSQATLLDTAAATRASLAGRLTVVALVLFVEKFILNFFVNFDGPQSTTRLGTIVNAAQLLGLRFVVSFAVLLALFGYVSGSERLAQVNAAARGVAVRMPWLVLQGMLVAGLALLVWFLDGERGTLLPFSITVALLGVLGLAAAMALFTAMAPWTLWLRAGKALGAVGVYALIAALIATCVIYWSQELWAPTARVTFELVRHLLTPIIPTLHSDPVTRVLSTKHFAVEVSDICSGLEGVGLMLAFCCAWLVCFRQEYVFPRALILIPCGLALIFALNVVRIAALVLIGNSGHPEVARYGFHSQAGWIAFNIAACGIALASRRIAWLNRTAATGFEANADNPTAAYLLPLLAILAAGILAHALSSGFDALDSLRLAAGALMLCVFWGRLAMLSWRFSWRGPVAGLLVFALWIAAADVFLPRSTMPATLIASPDWARDGWIAGRVATSVLVVPIAEELAYRGYLLRRIAATDFEAVGFRSVGGWPLLASSLLFGLAHGAMWLAGIAAGAIYGVVLIRTERIGEAVAAHATTNGLLAAYVLLLSHWEIW
jgi:exosortase E/protease (VPEID-CTERM system)